MQKSTPAGRPRSDLNATVFEATLRSVRELGYAGATMDRIAAAAGVAKTTLYRRWPSKGALIVDCLIDAIGPAALEGDTRAEMLESAVRTAAARIGEPGVGAAFAGVFSDAINDPDLREILTTRFQAPYLAVLKEALRVPEQRILLVVDVVAGTLLHRLGISGRPMVESDVDALIGMVRGALD